MKLNKLARSGPFVFVISGPSGAGKTSILNQIFKRIKNLKFSISYTTRPKRKGERNGRDYFFISDDEFRQMAINGEFLEFAIVHNHYYGTSRKQIEDILAKGKDAVLDIDVQGAEQVKKSGLPAIFIMILPPSLDELKKRLQKRKSETKNDMRIRLNTALKEIEKLHLFDFVVINDDLETAIEDLSSIIKAQRCKADKTTIEKVLNYFANEKKNIIESCFDKKKFTLKPESREY